MRRMSQIVEELSRLFVLGLVEVEDHDKTIRIRVVGDPDSDLHSIHYLYWKMGFCLPQKWLVGSVAGPNTEIMYDTARKLGVVEDLSLCANMIEKDLSDFFTYRHLRLQMLLVSLTPLDRAERYLKFLDLWNGIVRMEGYPWTVPVDVQTELLRLRGRDISRSLRNPDPAVFGSVHRSGIFR